jgi:hypothetical protein
VGLGCCRCLPRCAKPARERLRSAQRIRQAKRLVRRIEATAAVHATAVDRAARPTLYRRLLQLTQASVRQAESVQRALAAQSEATAQRLESAVRRVAPLVQQVIAQAERRVLHGESVPASTSALCGGSSRRGRRSAFSDRSELWAITSEVAATALQLPPDVNF